MNSPRQNEHITTEGCPLGDGAAPELSTVATFPCAARHNDGDAEHQRPDAVGECTEPDRQPGTTMEAHGWRPLTLYAPVELSGRELKKFIHRGVVVAAAASGEFVEAIRIAAAKPHADRWRRCHLHYLPGPPACAEPLWLPTRIPIGHGPPQSRKRRSLHDDQCPHTTAADRD